MYRGTAIVSVGSSVKAGDLLVDGIAVIKEQTVKINLLASITISCSATQEYRSEVEGEEEKAILFVEQNFADREIVSSTVKTEKINGEYVYSVTVCYKRVLCAG